LLNNAEGTSLWAIPAADSIDDVRSGAAKEWKCHNVQPGDRLADQHPLDLRRAVGLDDPEIRLVRCA
jgi:hypothetical protein